MKKYSICVFISILLTVFYSTSWAIESQWSGNFRTRWFSEKDWSGNSLRKYEKDRTQVDMRANVAYTANIHDNLKFVSDFRMESAYGGAFAVGSKPKDVKMRQLYMDFSLNNANFIIGQQDFYEARGLLIYDAAPAFNFKYDLNDKIGVNFIWMKTAEGSDKFDNGVYEGRTDDIRDLDFYIVSSTVKLNPNITFKPYLAYGTSDELWQNPGTWGEYGWLPNAEFFDNIDLVYLGFDADASFGPASVWFTAIYQTGTADVDENAAIYNQIKDYSISGFTAAGGGSLNLGKITLSGQLFFATGDDDLNDDDISCFVPGEGGYYYWSEIMGLGSNDDDILDNMEWALSNIIGGGAGVSVSPIDKLTMDFSLWYAAALEDFIGKKTRQLVEASTYGTEVNAVIGYELMDNLKFTFIGAYVFAGDAITEKLPDDANPYSVLGQLKLTF